MWWLYNYGGGGGGVSVVMIVWWWWLYEASEPSLPSLLSWRPTPNQRSNETGRNFTTLTSKDLNLNLSEADQSLLTTVNQPVVKELTVVTSTALELIRP